MTAAVGAAVLWAAPVLPGLGGGDPAALVAGGAGLLGVVALAALPVPAMAAPRVLWLAVPAAGLLVVALDVAGVGPAATPVEALAYATAGVAFAAVLDAATLALALPVFLAVVDVVSIAGGAAGGLQLTTSATSADALNLTLPAWGSHATVAQLNGVDVLFPAAFAAYALRFGLRPHATLAAAAAALVAALALTLGLDHPMPVLALVAAAGAVANAGRLGPLVAAARAG